MGRWMDVPSFFGHVVGYKLSRVALGTRMILRLCSYFSFRLGFRHFSTYDSFLNFFEGKASEKVYQELFTSNKKGGMWTKSTIGDLENP